MKRRELCGPLRDGTGYKAAAAIEDGSSADVSR
jgi:hypothetical protein